jgi:tetratricopeptide (TPR) repeat protein
MRGLAILAFDFLSSPAYSESWWGIELQQAMQQCQAGHGEAAIGGCTEVIEDSKPHPIQKATAYALRGIAYVREKNYNEALANYDKAVAIASDPIDARTPLDLSMEERRVKYLPLFLANRCYVLAVVGRLADALNDCDKSIVLEDKRASTYDARAFVHLKGKAFSAAIDDYNSALKLNPKLAASLYGRGQAKRSSGDVSGGDADIAAALAIDPKISERFGA